MTVIRILIFSAFLIPLNSWGGGGDGDFQDLECVGAVKEVKDNLISYRNGLRDSEIPYRNIYEKIGRQTRIWRKRIATIESCVENRRYPIGINRKAEVLSYLASQLLESAGRARINDYDNSNLMMLTIDRGLKFSDEILESINDQ